MNPKQHKDLDEREIANDMRSQKWVDVHDDASELGDSKRHSTPSPGYEFLRKQHNVCAVASSDGKRLCIMDAGHEGQHGWEAQKDQAAVELAATIRHAYAAGPARDAAIANLTSLVEQLEALRAIAIAARYFDARFEERFIHKMAKPLNDAISAYYASFPASEPKAS